MSRLSVTLTDKVVGLCGVAAQEAVRAVSAEGDQLAGLNDRLGLRRGGLGFWGFGGGVARQDFFDFRRSKAGDAEVEIRRRGEPR